MVPRVGMDVSEKNKSLARVGIGKPDRSALSLHNVLTGEYTAKQNVLKIL